MSVQRFLAKEKSRGSNPLYLFMQITWTLREDGAWIGITDLEPLQYYIQDASRESNKNFDKYIVARDIWCDSESDKRFSDYLSGYMSRDRGSVVGFSMYSAGGVPFSYWFDTVDDAKRLAEHDFKIISASVN